MAAPRKRGPRPPRTPGPRPGYDDKRYRANRELLKKTGSHICHICRHVIEMELKWPHPLSWSADHSIPRAHMGPDDPRHWQLEFLRESHLRCNEARGAKPLKPIPGIDGSLTTSIDW